jgi:hypothetical protein
VCAGITAWRQAARGTDYTAQELKGVGAVPHHEEGAGADMETEPTHKHTHTFGSTAVMAEYTALLEAARNAGSALEGFISERGVARVGG